MKKITLTAALMLMTAVFMAPVQAAEYDIDVKGAHAFIQFKIKHLGYSWLVGRFNKFDGQFSYDDKKPSAAKFEVTIDTTSIDSNHAERDKHLRGKDFLNTSKFPTAKFVSTSYKVTKKGEGKLKGKFTLNGVTKSITLDLKHVGQGNDPWGGFRTGFEGSTRISLKDFNITYNLGPASKEVELFLSIEGIRRK